jgi:hypothetical protein
MTSAVVSVEGDAPADEVLRSFASHPVHHMSVVVGGLTMRAVDRLRKLELRGGRAGQGEGENIFE